MEPVRPPLPSSPSEPEPGALLPWTKPTCVREDMKDALTGSSSHTDDHVGCS